MNKEFIVHIFIKYLELVDILNIFYSNKFNNNCVLTYKPQKNKIYKIDLYDYKIIDKLKNFKFETTLWHSKISNKELKYFKNIYSLNLYCCYHFDQTFQFKNIYSLSLFGCKNVTNVDCLSNIPILDLSFCLNLVDISKLGNNHTVLLRYCKNIRDVSSLKNIKILNISFCDNINDITMLGNLEKIYMYNSNPILLTQIKKLTKVKYIKF